MEKLITIILIVTLLIFSTVSVNAQIKIDQEKKLPSTLNLSVNNDGFYLESLSKLSILATMTKDYGIYKLPNGDLIAYTGGNTMQLVERHELSLRDISLVNQLNTLGIENVI